MSYVDDLLAESFKLRDIDNWWQDMLNQEGYRFCENPENLVENFVDNKDFDLESARERLPWGEYYAAELISKKFENLLGYNYGQNVWYLWNGIIHMAIDEDSVAQAVVRRFYLEYEKAYEYVEKHEKARASVLRAEGGTSNAGKQADNVVAGFKEKFAKHKAFRDGMKRPDGRSRILTDLKVSLKIDPRKFEDDTDWFVFRDGVVDCHELKRHGVISEILPHDPARNVTRFFDAYYFEDGDPNKGFAKEYGHWQSFLESSIPDDQVREYIQACVGAAFTGNTKLRTFLIFEGERSSGKSLFLQTFDSLGEPFDPNIPGTGYVLGNAKSDAIIHKKNGSNFSQAQFGSNRLVGLSEPNAREELDGEFLKEYTGDPTVSVEKKHKDPSKTLAQGLLIIATNEMPRMNSMDTAVMKRAKIVKFPYSFVDNPVKEHEKPSIDGLEDDLLSDRSAILHWILEGMLIHKNEANDLGVPYNHLENSSPAIMDRWSEEHKDSLQTPVQWVKELSDEGLITIDLDPTTKPRADYLKLQDAWQHFELWSRENGLPQFKRNAFMKMLEEAYGITPDDGESPIKVKAGGTWRFRVFRPSDKFDTNLSDLKLRNGRTS